jgi:hypothetical protein
MTVEDVLKVGANPRITLIYSYHQALLNVWKPHVVQKRRRHLQLTYIIEGSTADTRMSEGPLRPKADLTNDWLSLKAAGVSAACN